jgi:hypothetical protein
MLGRGLGADAVLVYGYQPKPGGGAEIQVYLLDVAEGSVIGGAGGRTKLAEITRDSFAQWSEAAQ